MSNPPPATTRPTDKQQLWHLCSFTTFEDVTLRVKGQSFRFAWSDRFGPVMLGKRGQSLRTAPSRRSRFWPALHWWIGQGKQVQDGEAVYTEPKVVMKSWLQVGRNLFPDTPEHRDQMTQMGLEIKVVELEEPR